MESTDTLEGSSVKRRLTIKEYAESLGVSEKTIRNKIKAGEIVAEMEEGPYGPQWFIDSDIISEAQQIIEVIKVKKEYDLEMVAAAFIQQLDKRDEMLLKN